MATALEELLRRIAAGRTAPIPEPAAGMPLGPLSTDTSAAFGALNPQPTPPAIVQPAAIDTGFVNAYAGAAPTAPNIPEPNFIDKIAAILSGVGGGPAVAEQIRQQRQAPVREYQRQLEDYNQRRTRGMELAERRAEREAEQANRLNDAAYEREFKMWLQKNSDRGDEQKERVRQAFIRERDATAARLEAEKEVQRERRQLERDARAIEERYFTASKNRALSRELGRYWAGLSDKPLSPAAARLDAKLQSVGEVRMQKASGGGGGGTGGGGGSSSTVQNTLAEFETLKQMAIQSVKAAGGTPRDEIEAVRRATATVVRKMARQPRLFEVGTGEFGFLYAKPRGGSSAQPLRVTGASPEGFPLAFGQPGAPAQGQAPPQGKTISRAEMKALGVTEKQAKAEGFTITP